jgi:hypothetical protein
MDRRSRRSRHRQATKAFSVGRGRPMLDPPGAGWEATSGWESSTVWESSIAPIPSPADEADVPWCCTDELMPSLLLTMRP